MLTKKYGKLFRCDYKGQTTIANTRKGARVMMEIVFFGGFCSFDERMSK
jgi:hypothetical protein